MAKNRRIPFGYQMKNGEIVTEPRELYAVSKTVVIAVDNCSGESRENCTPYQRYLLIT